MNDNYSKEFERNKILGDGIGKARKNAGLTMEQLVDKLKQYGVTISTDTLYHMEIGLIGIHDFELLAISKSLNVSIESLFSIE